MSAFNEPIRPRTFPLPSELKPGELILQVELAGMCGTDVHLHKGQLRVPLPLILGHETTGHVVAMGDSGTRDWLGNLLKVGDRVSFTVGRTCKTCRYCRVYRLPSRCQNRTAYGVSLNCETPPHLLGGYGQYHFIYADTAVFKLPDDLPSEALIGAGCALVTAIHGFEKMQMQWAESVLIQGSGPVGLAALAIAKEAGARPLIVIGGPRERLERCRRFGADLTIDIDEVPDPAARRKIVLDATGGLGADVVVECVGIPQAVVEGWDLCRDGAKYLVLGHYGDAGPAMLNPHLITRKELTVLGTWGSEPQHWTVALEFLRTRRERYPFHELITHRYGLHQVNEALEAVAKWQTGKAVIVPNG
ncbi:5-exo-hydroxycamphor dehydrogenase [Phycisphaerae bacterium RAS1]|nr:5-exo-hydroxycamphor dehydrogenase [Phycisphaerae bacterium RAS1]